LAGFAVSGFLVGFGTKLGNGCTSGHGVCGLPRFSIRSWGFIAMMMIFSITFANFFHYEHIFTTEKNLVLVDNSLIYAKLISVIGFIVMNSWFIYLLLSHHIKEFYSYFVTFLVAFTFALGLIISGFVKRSKVYHFLVFDKNWDASLAIILGTTFTMNYILFRKIFKK